MDSKLVPASAESMAAFILSKLYGVRNPNEPMLNASIGGTLSYISERDTELQSELYEPRIEKEKHGAIEQGRKGKWEQKREEGRTERGGEERKRNREQVQGKKTKLLKWRGEGGREGGGERRGRGGRSEGGME